MIGEAARVPGTAPARGPGRSRLRWLLPVGVVLILGGGLIAGRELLPGDPVPAAAPAATMPPVASPSPVVEATTMPSTSPTPSTSPAPDLRRLLRVPGAVPAHGSETFQYATRTGAVLGTKGPLRRFRVGVEKGSDENVDTFADQVEATLGDPRSWTGGGRLRLQLVGAGRPYDFTVYLATRDTAGELCLRGGTNVRIHGRPYTSCRTTGKAIINLDRWRLSAKPYLLAKVPLATYREYVINHEVGHELGHHHEGCPKAGGPAPVMVQQTITVRGCVPNAWPRRGDTFFSGP
jgi:hypothetical protein